MMIHSTKNRATIVKILALSLLLATLLATLLSTAAPAGAALPSGKAFAWGENYDGQLGNDTSGVGAESDVPVAVKNLTNVRNMDGGYEFTLAATQ